VRDGGIGIKGDGGRSNALGNFIRWGWRPQQQPVWPISSCCPRHARRSLGNTVHALKHPTGHFKRREHVLVCFGNGISDDAAWDSPLWNIE
jgi:hypothetical protein